MLKIPAGQELLLLGHWLNFSMIKQANYGLEYKVSELFPLPSKVLVK